MIASTTIFEVGDIVRVPFPHVERAVMVARPALVVSLRPLGRKGSLAWVAMITNAVREQWPGDIMIPNSLELGLIVESKVRTSKITAIEVNSATKLGKLDAVTLPAVRDELAANLGFSA